MAGQDVASADREHVMRVRGGAHVQRGSGTKHVMRVWGGAHVQRGSGTKHVMRVWGGAHVQPGSGTKPMIRVWGEKCQVRGSRTRLQTLSVMQNRHYNWLLWLAYYLILSVEYLRTKHTTRNSVIADKPRDAFRGQSRSPNIVAFHMLGSLWFPTSVL